MYDVNEEGAQHRIEPQELSASQKPTPKGGYVHTMHDQIAPINGVTVKVSLQISEFTVQELRKVLVKIMELARTALWVGPTYHLMTTP